jgi:hypothetical protein
MKSRASFPMAALVLIVCLVCPLAELFDKWDHTLQTGDDTEYALVILAMCVGTAHLLKRLVLNRPSQEPAAETLACAWTPTALSLLSDYLLAPLPSSSPPVLLRI